MSMLHNVGAEDIALPNNFELFITLYFAALFCSEEKGPNGVTKRLWIHCSEGNKPPPSFTAGPSTSHILLGPRLVIAVPDTKRMTWTLGIDEFVLLASDGVWHSAEFGDPNGNQSHLGKN